MQLPRLLMRVVDPLTAHIDDQTPRRRGPTYQGGAVFGPDVPGGSRQATVDEIENMGQRREDTAETPPPTAADRIVIARAAQDLISNGVARIDDGALAPVHARVVSFWRGDSLLQITAEGYESGTRVPRTLGPESAELLSSYLARAVGKSWG